MPNNNILRKQYAIMRYAKIRSWTALARVCQHNTRVISGENIRKDGPPPVELLEHGSDDFVASARVLMDELGIARETVGGKVLAVEAVTTASRAWFDEASDEAKRGWLRANVDWAKDKFGRGLLTAKLHLDEEVWHCHFVALPVVEKPALPRGKKPTDPVKLADYERRRAEAPMRWTLAYNDILGGKNTRLSEEQDQYHAVVKGFGLERGEIQRDDVEIEVGDELTVSALALSRGQREDGTARPRRSMTPAEGRAAVKRLHHEAEAIRQAAEVERVRAEQERVSSELARTATEAARAASETARVLADADRVAAMAALAEAEAERSVVRSARRDLEAEEAALEQARDNLRAEQAAVEKRALERNHALQLREAAAADAEADLKRRADDADRWEATIAEREDAARDTAAALIAARDAAEQLLTERRVTNAKAEAAHAAAVMFLKRAQRALADAEHDRNVATKAKDALAAEREQVERERELHDRQVALLVRASNDEAGLRLRLGPHPASEAGIVMDERAMLPPEWVAYMAAWSPMMASIAQGLARILETARHFTAKLLAREQAVAAQEAALARRLAESERDLASRREQQRVEHAAAVAVLTERSERLGLAETKAANAMEAAAIREAASATIAQAAKEKVDMHDRWAAALTIIDENPAVIVFDENGAASLDERVVKTLGETFIETFQTPMPIWAERVLTVQAEVAERTHAATDRERRAVQAAEQFEDLIRRVAPTLTPAQQAASDEARELIRRVAPWRAALADRNR